MAIIRNKDIIQREIAGEALLIPVHGDAVTDQRVFSLNPVGQFIWEQLEKPMEPVELAQAIVEHFNVDLAQAEEDVDAFIEQMQERHLVHVSL